MLDAVLIHGGEAQDSVDNFINLSHENQLKLFEFLGALKAPNQQIKIGMHSNVNTFQLIRSNFDSNQVLIRMAMPSNNKGLLVFLDHQ